MSVRMQGFAIQKQYQNGKVSKKGIFGVYDGDKAKLVSLKDGETKTASLSNHDIASLLALRSSPRSLVERLEHDLGRGQHRHHSHHRRSTRHHSHRRSTRHHSHHRRSTRHHKRRHSKHDKRSHHKRKHTRRRRYQRKHRTRHR